MTAAGTQRSGPRVQAIAWTQFVPPDDIAWDTDAEGGQALAEFAGRACYETWDKPNPATATNAGYLRHVLEVGHLAVLEHSSVTVYVRGVSRALAQELVRHRHLSFSQLSQRHAPSGTADVVEPAVIAGDPVLHERFVAATETALSAYRDLLTGLEAPAGGADSAAATLRRKQARQAARSVLPYAAETRLVVTGNYRAWRHFVGMRASEHADVEMRMVAISCLQELRRVAPNAFADFEITTLPDGTHVASSPFVSET
jgi:thymidylate synthase (FAD)